MGDGHESRAGRRHVRGDKECRRVEKEGGWGGVPGQGGEGGHGMQKEEEEEGPHR